MQRCSSNLFLREWGNAPASRRSSDLQGPATKHNPGPLIIKMGQRNVVAHMTEACVITAVTARLCRTKSGLPPLANMTPIMGQKTVLATFHYEWSASEALLEASEPLDELPSQIFPLKPHSCDWGSSDTGLPPATPGFIWTKLSVLTKRSTRSKLPGGTTESISLQYVRADLLRPKLWYPNKV